MPKLLIKSLLLLTLVIIFTAQFTTPIFTLNVGAFGNQNITETADDLGKKLVGEEKFANGKNILNPVHNPNAADDATRINQKITNKIDDAINSNVDDLRKIQPDVNPNNLDSPYKKPNDYNWVDEFGVPCTPLNSKPAKVSQSLSPIQFLVALVSPIGVKAEVKGSVCLPSSKNILDIRSDKTRDYPDW